MTSSTPLRSAIFGILLLLLFVSSSSATSTAPVIPGEAIVKITSGSASKSVLNQPGIIVSDSIPDERTYLIQFDYSRPVTGIVKMLTKNPHVEFAQANHKFELPEVQQISIGFPDQNRPIFSFGTNPPTYYSQPGVYETGLDSAQLLATGVGITVAVIDNGISFEHPLMRESNILSGHDFVDADSDPSEEDGLMLGHGTFVTGLVLLAAPQCQILPLRAFDGDGVGSEFNAAKAIRKAIEMDVDVINMSFGTSEPYPALTSMVDRALAAGIVLVASSGNYGTEEPIYPAAFTDVISVGAIDDRDVVAEFSNFGPSLDIVAPGVDVYSALVGEYDWGTWSGTSFSAPIVSGTIALVLQRTGPLPSVVIEKHLSLTARITLEWGELLVPDLHYGWGVLDAFSAVADAAKGDLDASGVVDANDLRILGLYVYEANPGLGRPFSVRQADLDCDGEIGAGDVEVLANYLFHGGRCPGPCTE